MKVKEMKNEGIEHVACHYIQRLLTDGVGTRAVPTRLTPSPPLCMFVKFFLYIISVTRRPSVLNRVTLMFSSIKVFLEFWLPTMNWISPGVLIRRPVGNRYNLIYLPFSYFKTLHLSPNHTVICVNEK